MDYVKVSWYELYGKEMTPEYVFNKIKILRKCQRHIESFSKDKKEDLEEALNLAFDFVCEVLDEHGIESVEQKNKFEDGCFDDWK